MTNLDSVLKSIDNTLQTELHIVKAMVFPVVVFGCESWTIKKAENYKEVNTGLNKNTLMMNSQQSENG